MEEKQTEDENEKTTRKKKKKKKKKRHVRRRGNKKLRAKSKSKLARRKRGEYVDGGEHSDSGESVESDTDVTLEAMYDTLLEVFTLMDSSGDGFVDFDEMRRGLTSNADIRRAVRSMPDLVSLLEPKTMRAAFDMLDADESGAVSFDEFFDGCVFALHDSDEVQMARKEYRQLFKMMDRNGDGELDLAELQRALRRDVNVMRLARQSEHLRPLLRASAFEGIKSFYAQMDSDGSGVISFEEFEDMCMGTVGAHTTSA